MDIGREDFSMAGCKSPEELTASLSYGQIVLDLSEDERSKAQLTNCTIPTFRGSVTRTKRNKEDVP
jgi:hypothetical protein